MKSPTIRALAALAALAVPFPAAAQSGKVANVPILPAGPLGFCPSSMAIDEVNGLLYVAFGDSPGVAKVDLTTTPKSIVGIAPFPTGCDDGTQLVIANLGGGHLHLWCLRSNNTIVVVEITPGQPFNVIAGPFTPASNAEDMVFDSATSRVFVCCPSTDLIVGFQDSVTHASIAALGAPFPVSTGAGSLPSRLVIADRTGVAKRLLIAIRQFGPSFALIKAMDTSTGAVSTGSLTPPMSPSFATWDVAFDGDPTSGRVLVTVRGGTGSAVIHVDPSTDPPSQVGSLMVAAMGQTIDDILCYRSATDIKGIVVRPPNIGVDGGSTAIVCMPVAGGGTLLGTPFTYPSSVKLYTTSGGGGGPGESHQNIAVDPARERLFSVHHEPFHVHVFDGVTGNYETDPAPSRCEWEGIVAVNRTDARMLAAACDSNLIGFYVSTAAPTPIADPPVDELVFPALTSMAVVSSSNKIAFTGTDDLLRVLDGATHAVSTINLGAKVYGGAQAVSQSSTNHVYVGSRAKALLRAVNLSTSAVTPITVPFPAGECPADHAFALDPAAMRLYIGSQDPVDGAFGSGSLFVVDTNPSSGAFHTVVNTFIVNPSTNTCDFSDMIVDKATGAVFALDKTGPTGQRVISINGATGGVNWEQTITSFDNVIALAVNATLTPPRLYVGVSSIKGSYIVVHNAATGASITSVSAGTGEVDQDGHDFFAVNETSDRTYFFAAPVNPPGAPFLKVINASDLLETTLGAGSADPCMFEFMGALVLNPTLGRLYTVQNASPNLIRHDGITPVATPSLTLGGIPDGVDINSATDRVYVSLFDTGSVDVFGNDPSVSSFTPTSGPVGTLVTITGTGFGGAIAVEFNGVSTPVTVNSDTSATAAVPAGATTGLVVVRLTATMFSSGASPFTVIPSPSIGGLTPSSGPVGTSVTITGSAFTGASAVTFNGVGASFTVISDTSISATVPVGATGTGPVIVFTPGGSASSAFTVTPPPSISGFSPASGPVGTSVSITGSGLTGVGFVSFGGVSAAFSFISDSSITATVPTGAFNGLIVVSTPAGSTNSASSFIVTASAPAPSISVVTPASGPVGTAVGISGSGFTGASGVSFNGVSAAFTVASDSLINTTVPAGATTGSLIVMTPGGSASSSFTVTAPASPAPSVNVISPASGPVGTVVGISGANFTGATSVAFNGVSAAFSVVTDGSINATVPAGATSGTVTVVTPGGSATSTGSFTVTVPVGAPTVSGFSPTSGTAGDSVSISGSNFTGATAVLFNGVSAFFSVISDTSISASVPAGAATGPIAVTTPIGTGAGSGSFTVFNLLTAAPGSANPPGGSALAGAPEVPVFQFDLVAGPADIDVSGIEFFDSGSGNPAGGGVTPLLWLDVNDNGLVDAPDVFASSSSFSADEGPALFSLPTGAGAMGRISAGTRKTFLLTYDLSGSLAPGQTFSVILYAAEIFAAQAGGGGGAAAPVSAVVQSAVLPKPGSGSGVRHPPTGPSIAGGVLTVAAPAPSASSSVQGGTSVNDFIMFAASIETGSSGFQQIEAQLGTSGTSGNFRLFRFDPAAGQYDEFPSTGFTSKYPTLNPAFGWWLIARNAGALTFTGTSTAVTSPSFFTLTIEPGWNQVGNPYSVPLPFELIGVDQVASKPSEAGAESRAFPSGSVALNDPSNARTLPQAYFFSGGSYFAETAAMQPRVGYWMKNIGTTARTVTFRRPPNALKAGLGTSVVRSLAPGEEAPPGPPAEGGDGMKSGGGGAGACFAGTPARSSPQDLPFSLSLSLLLLLLLLLARARPER